MTRFNTLVTKVNQRFSTLVEKVIVAHNELTLEVSAPRLRELCFALRDEDGFKFETLIDVCGVDYFAYGQTEWATESSTSQGFSRGVEQGADKEQVTKWEKPRFAVVYHFLSTELNHRIRVRCFADGDPAIVDSVHDIWNAANWFERETFDMYGILFKNHPDLRRILTDYGFIGHPFRKDFPLSGHVAMRYDAELKRVVYEPADIEERTLVPKVIRQDNRYLNPSLGEADNG